MEELKKLKLSFLFFIIFVISSVSFTQNIIADNHPHAIKGVLYINDEIAPDGVEIILSFPEDDFSTLTYEYNLYGDLTNYNLGFWDFEGETGYFYVKYQGIIMEPEDNKTILIEEGVIFYIVDLHIITPVNTPPNPPINPNPKDNSTDISINPYLSVDVSDPDDDILDVFFYDASDDSLINVDYNVNSGGTASVQWNGLDYDTKYIWYAIAKDSEYGTKSKEWSFTTKINQPPDKPINPQPEDNSEDVSLNPTLSVFVTDPDGDPMSVLFFDISDNSLIGADLNVASGSTASVQWNDLTYNTTYYWYVIVEDGVYETRSDNWSFTTKERDNTPPTVSIIKPQKGLYLFDRKILPRFIRPALIIGRITIEANATDADSGIEKVEFYINGKLKGNDTSAPYEFLWKRDRIRLFHIFVIKVVAYDYNGLTASDKMIVRKFL